MFIIILFIFIISCAGPATEQVTVIKKRVTTGSTDVVETTSFPITVTLPTNQNHLLVITERDGEKVALPVEQQGKNERILAIALPGGMLVHGIDRAMGTYFTFREKRLIAHILPQSSSDIEISILLSFSRFVHRHKL